MQHITRTNPGIVRDKIAMCNKERKETFSELYTACKRGDEKAIDKCTLKLGIYAGLPYEHGFSCHDLRHFLEPVSKRLNGGEEFKEGSETEKYYRRGLREVLDYKKKQLIRINAKISGSNGAGNNEKSRIYRDELKRAIHDLSSKVRYLSRIEGIVIDQLKKRGDDLLDVFVEERASVVPVTAK
jgi:hypothetical protein